MDTLPLVPGLDIAAVGGVILLGLTGTVALRLAAFLAEKRRKARTAALLKRREDGG